MVGNVFLVPRQHTFFVCWADFCHFAVYRVLSFITDSLKRFRALLGSVSVASCSVQSICSSLLGFLLPISCGCIIQALLTNNYANMFVIGGVALMAIAHFFMM